MEKARAISTAKHPIESNLGQALLRNNVYEGRLLSGELGKIGEQSRRQHMHLEQQRKLFLKNHVLPQPTIIIRRAPSPEIVRKAFFPELYDDDAYFFDPNLPPHYMKPRESQSKRPSLMHTMDLFKVKSKKKYNVWEEVLIEKEKPQFESAVRPSFRLSPAETNQLQRGYTQQQKKMQDLAANIRGSRSNTMLVPVSATKKKSGRLRRPHTTPLRYNKISSQNSISKSIKSVPEDRRDNKAQYVLAEEFSNEKATFITEIPEMRKGLGEVEVEQETLSHDKSVSFVSEETTEVTAKQAGVSGAKEKTDRGHTDSSANEEHERVHNDITASKVIKTDKIIQNSKCNRGEHNDPCAVNNKNLKRTKTNVYKDKNGAIDYVVEDTNSWSREVKPVKARGNKNSATGVQNVKSVEQHHSGSKLHSSGKAHSNNHFVKTGRSRDGKRSARKKKSLLQILVDEP